MREVLRPKGFQCGSQRRRYASANSRSVGGFFSRRKSSAGFPPARMRADMSWARRRTSPSSISPCRPLTKGRLQPSMRACTIQTLLRRDGCARAPCGRGSRSGLRWFGRRARVRSPRRRGLRTWLLGVSRRGRAERRWISRSWSRLPVRAARLGGHSGSSREGVSSGKPQGGAGRAVRPCSRGTFRPFMRRRALAGRAPSVRQARPSIRQAA